MNLTPSTNHSTLDEYNMFNFIKGKTMVNESNKYSYIAGIMDGDGSFSVGKLKTKANPLYFPVIQFTNWRRGVIDVLVDTFGGNVIKIKACIRKDGLLGHEIYRWRLRSRGNVKLALEYLIPYLRIKKKRAEFLLKFINEFEFIRGYRISSKVLEQRESAYIKVIQFNDWKSANNSITTKLAIKNTNDSIFWAYVAGMMDTDGSFSVKKQTKNKGTHVINPRYLPVILLSSIDTSAINYIRENCYFGNVYHPRNNKTSLGFHFQFGIYSKSDCAIFIKNILPFLIGKKENAKALLNFCENIKNCTYCRIGIPKEELSFREKCYQKLIALNKYGVYKPSLIDLEALPDRAGGDRAEGASHGERLSERAPTGDAIV